MRASNLVLMGVMAIVSAAAGCSGDVTTDPTGSGGSGGGTSTGGGGGTSTSDVGGGGGTSTSSTPTLTGTGPGTTLAIHELLVGDLLPNGAPSTSAWKGYGFNLDGKVSVKDSVDLC